jgi:phosphatidylserine decarboxylase
MRLRLPRGQSLRLPLASYGLKTAFATVGIFVALSVICAFFIGAYALLLLIPAAFDLYFFRDPERQGDEVCDSAVLSAADGKVIAVTDGEMPVVGGRATLIDVFLSVFDVHINRAPLAGRVVDVVYRRGQFLNALRSRAGDVNESNTVILEVIGGQRVAVKQIAGVIARRIVCPVQKGDELSCGERFGMIEFGSRTQVYISASMAFKPSVRIGQHVKAGKTVLGHVGKANNAEANT